MPKDLVKSIKRDIYNENAQATNKGFLPDVFKFTNNFDLKFESNMH